MEEMNTRNWKFQSPATPGFHTVVTPENSDCEHVWFFRLNLLAGQDFTLEQDGLELSSVVIDGEVDLARPRGKDTLGRFDSFYQPGGMAVQIHALQDSILYIGGAVYEGVGAFFLRRYDPDLPIGEVNQVHGKPPYQRSVFQTVNQEMPASRLITGLTWGEEGKWTSWPPHQHEDDLEEVYAFFDIPAPKFAMHIAYLQPGEVEVVHRVSSGDCVIIPRGYHPTVGMPGVRSSYFWVMAARKPESRSYNLAVDDPRLSG